MCCQPTSTSLDLSPVWPKGMILDLEEWESGILLLDNFLPFEIGLIDYYDCGCVTKTGLCNYNCVISLTGQWTSLLVSDLSKRRKISLNSETTMLVFNFYVIIKLLKCAHTHSPMFIFGITPLSASNQCSDVCTNGHFYSSH